MFCVSFSTENVSSKQPSSKIQSESSCKPGSGNLFLLRKLEEILYRQMKISTLGLEIHFSQKNLAIKNFDSATNCRTHRAIDGLRLVSEFSKRFMGAETKEGEKRGLQRGMGKKLLTDSRASRSSEAEKTSLMNTSRSKVCRNSRKDKEVSQASGVEQLHERLRILEEEMDIMKQELYEHTEERRKLVHEIRQQFQTIQNCLQLRNQMEREGTSDACFLSHNDKEEGLRSSPSEVLHSHLSPRIVTRDQRTDILALLEAVDTVILK